MQRLLPTKNKHTGAILFLLKRSIIKIPYCSLTFTNRYVMNRPQTSLFLILSLLMSCFDSPEFSIVPKIKFENLYFGKAQKEFTPDSLVLQISFEDGDGDLGIDPVSVDEPFHPTNFFLAHNGTLSPVGTRKYHASLPPFLAITPNHQGKLATLSTSRKSVYQNKMANYASDTACIYYSGDRRRSGYAIQVDSLLIHGAAASVINESSHYYQTTRPGLPEPFFVVKDTFYVQPNPAYDNIEVRFFRKPDANSQFEEVDFYKLMCQEIFEGRFQMLSGKENPVSGKITYSMSSTQFENVLGNGIWQLEIRIRDRALHLSNAIRSDEFTLP